MTKENNRLMGGTNMSPVMNIIVKADMSSPDIQSFTLCLICGGTGKLKTMQMAMTFDAGPVRVDDTNNTCPYCKGVGRFYHGG